jgi:hypothetical protein
MIIGGSEGMAADLFFRVAKSLVMAAIMIAATWVLTGSPRVAIVAGLIPFVLGMVNILTNVAYSITAGVFILAVAVQVIGEDSITEARTYAEDFVQNARVVRHARDQPKPEIKAETKAEPKAETTK